MVSDEEFKRLVLEKLDRVEADVASLKTDVASLKTDVASLMTITAQLEVRVARLEREEFHHYTSISRDLTQLRSDFTFYTLNFDTRIGALEQQMTDVAGTLEDVRTAATTSTSAVLERLVDHNRRLGALENRRLTRVARWTLSVYCCQPGTKCFVCGTCDSAHSSFHLSSVSAPCSLTQSVACSGSRT